MRCATVFLLFLLLPAIAPAAAWAFDAPPGQTHIGPAQVLRGHFVQTHQGKDKPPVRMSGSFVIAPATGLIWGVEKPFPTATVITPAGMAQEFGGIAALKIPASKLPAMRHLYDTVGHALEGDWSGLEEDYVLHRSGAPSHWQVAMTPRDSDSDGLHYASITVTGGTYVDNITLSKANGSTDTLAFSSAAIGAAPPSSQEAAAFAQAAQ
jgi:hypothetical protein